MKRKYDTNARKARRTLRKVARIMRSIGDTRLATKYQNLSRRI